MESILPSRSDSSNSFVNVGILEWKEKMDFVSLKWMVLCICIISRETVPVLFSFFNLWLVFLGSYLPGIKKKIGSPNSFVPIPRERTSIPYLPKYL